MTDNARNAPRFQLSIASVLLMFTVVAVLIVLVRHADTFVVQILFALVILLAVPYSWMVDRAGSPVRKRSLSNAVYVKRSAAIVACCLLSMFATYLAIWTYGWAGVPSKTPPSLFIGISIGLSILAQVPLGDGSPAFADHVYLAIPACGFVYLCLPILRQQECTSLPFRSTVILIIYSVTDICWFVAIPDFAMNAPSAVINTALLVILWGTWLWWQGRFDASKIVVWNLILAVWLFYFSHPFV